MYLIVSATEKYISKIGFDHNVINANTVGHEIHITRPIVLLLLSMNLINITDTIVTKNNERFFLYSNIFSNVIGYDDIPSNTDDSQIIDIAQANMWFHGKADIMHMTDLEKRFPVLTQIRIHKNIAFRTETYNNLITNMYYKDCSDIIKGDYIVIHQRIVNYSNNVNYSPVIISEVRKKYPSLQIFVFCINKIDGYPENVTYIHDISVYASLMNNEQCKAVITEFSGAGQLSQYCHRNKIFYFCMAYPFYPEIPVESVILEANQPTNLYNRFDMKVFTLPSIYIFTNINLLLRNFSKYYDEIGKNILRI